MAKRKCGRCGGEGFREDVEGRRLVRDACYHCSNTGEIDEETYRNDRIESAAETLAHYYVSKLVIATNKAAIEEETGEGWAFAAAENMMSDMDYTKARAYEETDRAAKILRGLPPLYLEVLLDVFAPERITIIEAEKKEAPKAEEKPASDDLPF